MKRILDPSFRYTPSFDTDVRRTFERIRRLERARTKTRDVGSGSVKVLPLERLKQREAK
jgi:hypothetical protein